MKVTAWNNGQHHKSGAGYGLKIKAQDRDRHFDRAWRSINLYLPNARESIEVNIDKRSFWELTCRELIHRGIGEWLLSSGIAPWEKGSPPNFELEPLEGTSFRISA